MFESPAAVKIKPKLQKPLAITSPLITNRGINKLKEISSSYEEDNAKTMTPDLPSRTSGLALGQSSQLTMNKIIRKDMDAKPPKPALPRLSKFDKKVSEKSSSDDEVPAIKPKLMKNIS